MASIIERPQLKSADISQLAPRIGLKDKVGRIFRTPHLAYITITIAMLRVSCMTLVYAMSIVTARFEAQA